MNPAKPQHMKIIDISVAIDKNVPVWPTASPPQCVKTFNIEDGHPANDSAIQMGVHTGTHIDAPLHFINKGKSIDKLPLEIFIGPTRVVHLPRAKEITADDLDKLKIPKNITRILFKTSNSLLWSKGAQFKKDYVGLTISAAKWLSKQKIKLVGVDYLSIAKFDEAVEVHKILLGKGTVLLEGINLSKVKPGIYQLICLPVKFSNLEASPARAVLWAK